MLRIDRIPLLIACLCIVSCLAFAAADESDNPQNTTSATTAQDAAIAEVDSADALDAGAPAAKEGPSSEPEHDADGESHTGGHHDATDLGHQNTSGNVEDVMNFKTDLAVWTFVVFLCLLAILGKFAWGPIMEGLEKREQSIASMIDEAKQSQEKAAEQLKQYEEKIAAAGEESREIVAQARKDAEAAAEKQRERAVADIANATNVALQEITDKSVDIAVQLAGRIARRELTAQDHSQLIDEALKQLPSRN